MLTQNQAQTIASKLATTGWYRLLTGRCADPGASGLLKIGSPAGMVALAIAAGLAVAFMAAAEISAHHPHRAFISYLREAFAWLPSLSVILLGAASGTCAGLLAGLIGIGGGIVIVPAVYYGLVATGLSSDLAAHVAVGTSLAAILPAAVVSSIAHWRAGNADIDFLMEWGPGIVAGVVAAQLVAPHVSGSLMTGVFGLSCLLFAARFAFPCRFRPITEQPPKNFVRSLAGVSIGLVSGLAGVGGGIMTNVVMSLSGLSIHRCIGRAAAVGVVVSVPATVVAAFGPGAHGSTELGSIDLVIWACVAPTQAASAWLGARLAQRIPGHKLSRVMAAAVFAAGGTMLWSSLSS